MSKPLGFHTLSVYLKMTAKELSAIREILKDDSDTFYRVKQKNRTNRSLYSGSPYTNYNYSQMYKGLSWTLMYRHSSPEYMKHYYCNPDDPNDHREEDRPCSVSAKINPKYLTGRDDEYITSADSSYIEPMIEKFNCEVRSISPILKDFSSYSLSRNDYCINFDLARLGINSFPEIYMILLKRADIPHHFTEFKKYDKDDTSHRKKSDADSFYLKNKSLNINCYNKYSQMKKKDPDNPDIEKYRYLIRFEIQCKYLKIRYMMKQMKDCNGIKEVLAELLDDKVCEDVLFYYYYKTIGNGDYYTLPGAKAKVRSMNYNRNRETRLIEALELVSKSRSIFHAKSHLDGNKLNEFRRSIKDLGDISVNPVTIPQGINIKFLPNLMKAYLTQREKEEAAWAAAYPKKVRVTEL